MRWAEGEGMGVDGGGGVGEVAQIGAVKWKRLGKVET